jgi:hypothetical protein
MHCGWVLATMPCGNDKAGLLCPAASLVARLEKEGIDNENGVDVLSSLAGFKQGWVVMQAQSLRAGWGRQKAMEDQSLSCKGLDSGVSPLQQRITTLQGGQHSRLALYPAPPQELWPTPTLGHTLRAKQNVC